MLCAGRRTKPFAYIVGAPCLAERSLYCLLCASVSRASSIEPPGWDRFSDSSIVPCCGMTHGADRSAIGSVGQRRGSNTSTTLSTAKSTSIVGYVDSVLIFIGHSTSAEDGGREQNCRDFPGLPRKKVAMTRLGAWLVLLIAVHSTVASPFDPHPLPGRTSVFFDGWFFRLVDGMAVALGHHTVVRSRGSSRVAAAGNFSASVILGGFKPSTNDSMNQTWAAMMVTSLSASCMLTKQFFIPQVVHLSTEHRLRALRRALRAKVCSPTFRSRRIRRVSPIRCRSSSGRPRTHRLAPGWCRPCFFQASQCFGAEATR